MAEGQSRAAQQLSGGSRMSLQEAAAKVTKGLVEKGIHPSQLEGKAELPTQTPIQPDVPDSSPETPAPERSTGTEQQKETPQAPPSDKEVNFQKLRQRLNQEKAKAKRLEQELEKARQAQPEQLQRTDIFEAILSEREPEGFEDWDTKKQQAWWAGQAAREAARAQLGEAGLSEMRKAIHELKVMQNLPNMTADQAAAVSSISLAIPSLSPEEALALAKHREPELWIDVPDDELSEEVQVPPAQRVQPPDRSGANRKPENKKSSLVDAVKEAANPRDQTRAAGRLMAALLKESGVQQFQ